MSDLRVLECPEGGEGIFTEDHPMSCWREPTVEEVIEWLPPQFWDAMAIYLSGIRPEFTPILMRLKLAEAVAAAYEEMGI